MLNTKVRRALRQLARACQKFEPDFARAVDEQDAEWLRHNFVPMAQAVIEKIIALSDVIIETEQEDDEALDPALHGICVFMAGLADIAQRPDLKSTFLSMANEWTDQPYKQQLSE